MIIGIYFASISGAVWYYVPYFVRYRCLHVSSIKFPDSVLDQMGTTTWVRVGTVFPYMFVPARRGVESALAHFIPFCFYNDCFVLPFWRLSKIRLFGTRTLKAPAEPNRCHPRIKKTLSPILHKYDFSVRTQKRILSGLRATHRCQDLVAKIWQPGYGSQKVVAKIWQPRSSSQDLLARIW